MIAVRGIARLIGKSRRTVYRRIQEGKLDIDGVPSKQTTAGKVYDMEGVIRRFFPSADGNLVATMMYDFMQEHGGLVK